jgi:hypothetical protein
LLLYIKKIYVYIHLSISASEHNTTEKEFFLLDVKEEREKEWRGTEEKKIL